MQFAQCSWTTSKRLQTVLCGSLLPNTLHDISINRCILSLIYQQTQADIVIIIIIIIIIISGMVCLFVCVCVFVCLIVFLCHWQHVTMLM